MHRPYVVLKPNNKNHPKPQDFGIIFFGAMSDYMDMLVLGSGHQDLKHPNPCDLPWFNPCFFS